MELKEDWPLIIIAGLLITMMVLFLYVMIAAISSDTNNHKEEVAECEAHMHKETVTCYKCINGHRLDGCYEIIESTCEQITYDEGYERCSYVK